ncbi:alpha/beta hydrolase [Pontibacillus salipaludis]|uniref:alpha/beta hydrolase n=1 Tax=Pontibacillus salipaludis TaxID=1697394 RepID=UPI0031E916D3
MVEEKVWTFKARDEADLQYYFYSEGNEKNKPTIIFIHGITAELHHIRQFASKAKKEVNVIIPILRGYHPTLIRGDLQYKGQYDDDLEDLCLYLQSIDLQNVYWCGHSMGCGNLLRVLKKETVSKLSEGFIFLSPFFHPTLPVYNFQNSSNKDLNDIYELKLLKSILLYTLHQFKVQIFSKTKVVKVPDDFHENKLLHLSFRLMISRIPDARMLNTLYKSKIPLFMMIGDEDEVTDATKLAEWWKGRTNHPYKMQKGHNHNTIISEDSNVYEVIDWVKTIFDKQTKVTSEP